MKTYQVVFRILAWSIGLGGLAWLIFTDSGNTYLAPGALDKKHAGKSVACMRCHQAFAGVPDSKCASCHRREGVQTKVASRVGGSTGLHVGVRGECVGCHRVHSKRKRLKLTPARHRQLGYSLHEHERVKCLECHRTVTSPASARLCNRCHLKLEDRAEFSAHAGDISSILVDRERARAAAGGSAGGSSDAAQVNASGVAGAELSGGHIKARDKFEGARACTMCHNGGDDVRYVHLADGPVRDDDSKVTRNSAFFRGGHSADEEHACVKCHKQSLRAPLSRNCADCHRDVHGERPGMDCRVCHNTISWEDRASAHSLTWKCTDCHSAPAEHPEGACQRCHQSTRDWDSAVERHSVGSDCVNCHDAPKLHYQGTCQSCHSSTTDWKKATFAHPRVREHYYRSMACTNCHPNGYQQTSCTPCHRTNDPGDDDEGEGREGGDDD